MRDRQPFFMAGLWSEEPPDPETGEVRDSYTVVIGEANAAMRIHDRMPVILDAAAVRRWLEPGPLPADVLTVFPADAMEGWRVPDIAKNSRAEPVPEMAEPVERAISFQNFEHFPASTSGVELDGPSSPRRYDPPEKYH